MYITVLIDSLGLVKSVRKVIMKNKLVVEDVKLSWKTVSDWKAASRRVEEDLVNLKGLFSASDELTANLADSGKCLQAAGVEIRFLKEQVEHAGKEKTE